MDLSGLLQGLSASEDSVYALSRDLRLVQTNDGWRRFARENGGDEVLAHWSSGASIMDAIPSSLCAFYSEAFRRAFATGERWEHDYECSSADVYRQYRMVVYPFEGLFLVVVNALLIAAPHTREPCSPDRSLYMVDGIIGMCSHCRRVRNPKSMRWDWVPDFVRRPPANLSHGLCEPCLGFYYGESGADGIGVDGRLPDDEVPGEVAGRDAGGR